MKKNCFTPTSILLTTCCLAAMTVFTGCNDDNKNKDGETGILKPIAENITGKWNMEESHRKQDGKWVEDPIPEGQELTYTLRTDGTVVGAQTMEDGFTTLHSGKWKTDENANTLTFGTMTVGILSLDANSFEMDYGEAVDTETGETLKGEFKWKFTRMDETVKTPIEKLIGKWVFKKSYKKENGEWKEYNQHEPDEAWCEWREDGTGTLYFKAGSNEHKSSGAWSMNNTTSVVRTMSKDGQATMIPVTFEDDNTYSQASEAAYDPEKGEIVETGEFKDVYVRVQE